MTMTSLAALREAFRIRLEAAGSAMCPCCDRTARIRKGSLNAGMVKVLLRMVALTVANRQEWLHIRDIFGSSAQKYRDWTQLKHWGLVEPRDTKTSTENSSGYWRVTPDGHDFVRKVIIVPRHVFTYNDACLRESDESITVEQALGEDFDYRSVFQGF